MDSSTTDDARGSTSSQERSERGSRSIPTADPELPPPSSDIGVADGESSSSSSHRRQLVSPSRQIKNTKPNIGGELRELSAAKLLLDDGLQASGEGKIGGGGIWNPAADINDLASSAVAAGETGGVKSKPKDECSSESEEESFLSLLFRRSTLRRSRRNRGRRPSQTVPTSCMGDQQAGVSTDDVSESGRRESGGGLADLTVRNLRRSLRRLFRRNDSFYRAQRNSEGLNRDSDGEDGQPPLPPPRSDSISPVASSDASENGASVTDVNDLTACEAAANLLTTDSEQPGRRIPILLNGQAGNDNNNNNGSNSTGSLRRNEARRSVRFNLNRITPPTSPTSNVNNESASVSDAVGDSQFTPTENVVHNILHQMQQQQPVSPTNEVDRGRTSPSNRRPERHQRQSRRNRFGDDDNLSLLGETDDERRKRVGFWPHAPCSMLASMACTLSMGNICRFSFLSFQYGGGFILQFLMLTVMFGFPMVSLFMTLGQYMGCGMMDMWKVSPVFQGIGVASLIATTLIGIYSIVPVSWLFVYFRDSFVVTNGFFFKWAECSPISKPDVCKYNGNFTSQFRNTVPGYFHARVLQRSTFQTVANSFGDLKFENVFNLAVVWMLVFICLSKGLKSYGKVVFAFAIFPLLGFLIFSVELLRQAEGGTEYIMNLNTNIYDTFVSGASWMAAAREVFFTWGIHGAVLMQIMSHNPFKHNVKRDSSCVILVTLSTLLLSSFIACACFSVVFKHERGAIKYFASSFENERSITFLAPNPEPLTPLRKYWSNNFLLGEEMMNFDDKQFGQRSNYQVFRLVTELFPAAVAYIGANNISPFWSVLLYLTLITFGIAQQLAIWRCVIESIVAIKPSVLRTWETTITFVTCIMGFVLGLPLTTEFGIFVVYFFDFCVGSAWWIMIIYLMQVLAVFIVRGKPYSADQLVCLMASDKFSKKWLSNLIAFSWNVITPVGLLVLSIVSFRSGMYGRMFNWFDSKGYPSWPTWVRQIGTVIQLVPLMVIPVVGLIQTCRYMAKGPPDLFDRLQMLYRPVMRTPPDGEQAVYSDITGHSDGIENPAFADDPPPKYTPPPSYNTATGRRLLKHLNSLRRSFRSSMRGRAAAANLADVEMATAAAAASAPNDGTAACCSHSLPSPFFVSIQDVDNQHPSTSRIPSSSTT